MTLCQLDTARAECTMRANVAATHPLPAYVEVAKIEGVQSIPLCRELVDPEFCEYAFSMKVQFSEIKEGVNG